MQDESFVLFGALRPADDCYTTLAAGGLLVLKGNRVLRMESDAKFGVGQLPRRLHFLYHELRPGGSGYSYVLDPDAFCRHLELFDQLRRQKGRSLWPEVTFDDGHISNYAYALPALQSRGWVARFFITAGWTGTKPGYMGWNELRALRDAGQRIGAHGWSHMLLTHCSAGDLDRELNGARQTLEDKLGTEIRTISLPGGRANERVLAACREAGYTQIYTSVPRAEPATLGFLVGRLNVRGAWTPEQLAALLEPESRALRSLERQSRIKATAQRLLGDRLYEGLWALGNRKGAEGSGGEEFAG